MKLVFGGVPGGRLLEELRAEHPDVEFVAASPDTLTRAIQGADAYLGYALPREAYLAAGPQLRWVHATSAGIERIVDNPDIVASDVIVTNARGGHAACIAEHTFAMLLLLTRQLLQAHADQQAHSWDRSGMSARSRELTGSTMVILGMGNIGQAIAKRAIAFDLRVIGVDLKPGAPPAGVEAIWGMDRLDEALALADVFVVTLPITPETRNLIDARRIGLLKQGAYLLVVSRGGIINEPALIEALRSGKVAGAGLDVQETEPMPPDDPLWEAPNLILTPHCSAASNQTSQRVTAITKENIERFLKGEPLLNICDKRAGF
jgi:phosphoglycerate dehydrogenase-like enzyme